MLTYDQLCGEARLQVCLGKMEGVNFDKKITRFNDIAKAALRYGAAASHTVVDRTDIIKSGFLEAIDSCNIDSDMYTGANPKTLVYDWMIPVELRD